MAKAELMAKPAPTFWILRKLWQAISFGFFGFFILIPKQLATAKAVVI